MTKTKEPEVTPEPELDEPEPEVNPEPELDEDETTEDTVVEGSSTAYRDDYSYDIEPHATDQG